MFSDEERETPESEVADPSCSEKLKMSEQRREKLPPLHAATLGFFTYFLSVGFSVCVGKVAREAFSSIAVVCRVLISPPDAENKNRSNKESSSRHEAA